jgi:hypothetical protein
MTEKRQTFTKLYIIRILQHFATKLQNITNFVMLFQAVMKFLSRLSCLDQNFTQKGKGLLNVSQRKSAIFVLSSIVARRRGPPCRPINF